MLSKALLVLTALASTVVAQSPVWGQCGGIGWGGPTTCVSGACCTVSNPYYSQCIPGTCGGTGGGGTTTTTGDTTPTTTSAPLPSGTAAGSAGCGKNPLTSGTFNINVNGKTRQYILRVPNNYDRNNPYRLIFTLHWGGGTMTQVVTGETVQRDVWSYYGLQRIANETAIFVSPQGFNNGWGNNGGEDTAFIDALVNTISNGLCVNPRLIFSTGFSYGAGMSYSLACDRANVFRAVAVLSGGLVSGCNGGTTPIAYLGIHGVSDNVAVPDAGRSIRDRVVRTNGCQAQNPPEPAQGSLKHIKMEYSGCKEGFPVVWIAFDEGHIAAPHDGGRGDSGTQTFSPGETWSFFTRFT